MCEPGAGILQYVWKGSISVCLKLLMHGASCQHVGKNLSVGHAVFLFSSLLLFVYPSAVF